MAGDRITPGSEGRIRLIAVTVAVVLAVVVIALAVFPVGWLKAIAERKLSDQVGRPVTIGAVERESVFSFVPVIRITDVSVPQPAWAGPGKLASIAEVRVQIGVFGAVLGRARPRLLSARGATINLVRGADRRENWRTSTDRDGAEGTALSFEDMGNVDATVNYRDAFQKRMFAITAKADPKNGLVARGRGEIDGNPVTIAMSGPARATPTGWPFEAAIDGAAIAMRATGKMARPLDTGRMTLHVAARANDLKLLDRVIEAGLFGTQPVRIAADVRHEPRRWTIEKLGGSIGTSTLTGRLTVDKLDGRSKLDGAVTFQQLDFADLATDAGNARALALKQAEGARIVPNTRINIRKIDSTDGRIAFRIDRIVQRGGPSALRSASGVLHLDHRLLIVSPLRIALSKGVIEGQARVDQRQGQPEPTVTLALTLHGSSIGALAGNGDGEVDAPVDGRVRLTGVGSTIREAVGRSTGTIGVVAHDGSMPAKMASLLGFDVGRSLFTDDDTRASLRCAVVRLDMRDGVGTVAPLVVDTTRSQTRGTGTIRFPAESIAITLSGAPKRGTVLRLPGSIAAGGTIRDPSVVIPKQVKSVGNVLKAIGRAISGKQGAEAMDANCTELRRQALGA